MTRATLTLAAAFAAAYLAMHLALASGGADWVAALVGTGACWTVLVAVERRYLLTRLSAVRCRWQGLSVPNGAACR